MRTGLISTFLLGLGCSAHVVPVPAVSSRTLGSCTLEVLSLPPSTPYMVLGQGWSDNMTEESVSTLFQKGCDLGADAFVAPLPPEAFEQSGTTGRLAGTFIRRCSGGGCPASQASR